MITSYFVFIHRPGPNWLTGKPIMEQPLDGHFQYISQLQEQGMLILGGGFLDNTGALGVIVADNIEQAKDIIFKDPAVKKKIVTTEIHPWFVTVSGCIKMDET